MNAKMKTRIRSLAVAGAAAFVLICGNARAQVTKQQTPPPVRAQVSGQPMQQRALKPAPLKSITAYNGKISGVVYWDTTKVVRNTEATLVDLQNKTETTVAVPPGCDGTAVYVWITDQTAQWGAWQASTSTFSYSTNGSSAICAYTIDRVPTGQALSVAAYIPSEDYSFKTGMTNYGDMAAVPVSGAKATWWYTWGGGVGGVGASVTVANTPCRDLISFASPGTLDSGSRSCGGVAANVNFVVGSYSDYMTNLFGTTFGSAQKLSASQASRVPQAVRLRQTLSGGAITTQSARSTIAAASGQQISVSPSSARLTNLGPQQTPMLGAPAQPLLASGNQPGTLSAQTSGTTSATLASGVRTASAAAGARVAPAQITPNGGSQAGPVPIPSKGHQHSAYDAVAAQRGVTSDPNFTNWTNSANRSTVPANATNICLNKAFIRSVNGKIAPQIPFAGGSDGQGTVIAGVVNADITFRPGTHYIISGCGFGTTAGRVYLLGQFPAHGGAIILEPYHESAWPQRWGSAWSDRQIDAEIDPNFSGELSQSGVALVIETSSGTKLQAFGFSFSP